MRFKKFHQWSGYELYTMKKMKRQQKSFPDMKKNITNQTLKRIKCVYLTHETNMLYGQHNDKQIKGQTIVCQYLIHLSLVMRKPAFCICENKDADQLRGDREADQRLCFRYTDTKIILLSKSEIPSFQPSSVAVQPGLCGAWSETPKTGFLRTRLI